MKEANLSTWFPFLSMKVYTLAQDMIFVILTLISALALFSEHLAISIVSFVLAALFISYENRIYEYVKKA